MVDKYSYSVSLNKEESKLLKDKYVSKADLSKKLWEGVKSISNHEVRAVTDSLLNDDYLCLKIISDTLDGLVLGVEYLKKFTQ